MDWIVVKNQAELDAATRNGNGVIINYEWLGTEFAELRDSSHAELRDSSHAVLWGSSHAELRDSSHAVLRDSSHAVLWDFAVCHYDAQVIECKSPRAVAIRVDYPADPREWAVLKGLTVSDTDEILLWKTTRADGADFRTGKLIYAVGAETIASDWDPNFEDECGAGLHLADSPAAARSFVSPGDAMFRLFRVRVKFEDCRCFPGRPQYPMKLRARACFVEKEFPRDYCGE